MTPGFKPFTKKMKVVLTYHHPSEPASAFCSSLLAYREDDVPGDGGMAYHLKKYVYFLNGLYKGV